MESMRNFLLSIILLSALLLPVICVQNNLIAEETPSLYIESPKDTIYVNESIEVKIILSEAPNGLSGYNISISVSNSSVAKISRIIPPEWVALQENGSISEDTVWIKAIDFYEKVQPGSENITLVSIVLEGISEGSVELRVIPNAMDDDYGNTITVSEARFTISILKPKPRFSLTLQETSITVEAGERFSINVTVINNGTGEGTAEIRLKDHNENIVDSKNVTLDPGSSTTITLSGIVPSSEGTYEWTVEVYNVNTGNLDQSQIFTLNVEVRYPYFTSVLDKAKIVLEPGDTFSVCVNVTNNGTKEGTAEIRLRDHNGNIVDLVTVTLGVGESVSAVLSGIAPNSEGTYEWTIETYNTDNATIDDIDTLTLTVEVKRPHFTTTLEQDSITVEPCKPFFVNVTITNDGEAAGTVEIRLKDHENKAVFTQSLKLEPGVSTIIIISATAPTTEGTYQWTIETYNTDNATIDDIDTLTLTVEVKRPHFTTTLDKTSISLEAGEKFSLNVIVTNDGEIMGSVEIRLKDHNGNIVDSLTTTLDVGISKILTLSANAPDIEGTYNWTIETYNIENNSIDDIDTLTLNVRPPPYPHFIATLEQTSITVEAGEAFTVSVTVTNDGTGNGTVEIRLKDQNGNLVDKASITLEVGTSETVTLSGTAPETEGTYEWIVETYNIENVTVDDVDTLTLKVEIPQTLTPTPTPTLTPSLPPWQGHVVSSGIKEAEESVMINDAIFLIVYLDNPATVYWEVYDINPVGGLDGVRYLYVSTLPQNSIGAIQFKVSSDLAETLGGKESISLFYYDESSNSWKVIPTAYLGDDDQGNLYFKANVENDGLYAMASAGTKPTHFPSTAIIAIIVVATVAAVILAYYYTSKR